MFKNVDWSLVQKKVLQNPKMSAGAAGFVAAALIYLFSASSSNDIDDENIDSLPDFAKPDCDFAFTQRFGNKNKDKSRSNRRPKRSKEGNKNAKEEKNEDINEEQKDKKYSLLDPNNPDYTQDMKQDEDNDTVECNICYFSERDPWCTV